MHEAIRQLLCTCSMAWCLLSRETTSPLHCSLVIIAVSLTEHIDAFGWEDASYVIAVKVHSLCVCFEMPHVSGVNTAREILGLVLRKVMNMRSPFLA
jgi:hypothetical protein